MSIPLPEKEWLADELRVAVYPTRAEMGAAAAAEAAAALQGAIERQGYARIILASAPSQDELVAGLVKSSVNWSKVTIFHMDEYVGLADGHPATFRSYQQQHTLAHVKPAAFHGIRGESADPQAECDRYSALLAEAPIDLVCMGIGENGHIAFNDPPVADFNDPALIKIVQLDEVCRQQQVNDGCFPNLDAVPRLALSLTIPALVGGQQIFCVVPGPRKASAVQATLQGPIETSCPASILRRHSRARLYLDRASAALVL